MKAKQNTYGEYITAAWDKYLEIRDPQPSSRVLEGSRDHGYDQEYIGHGAVDGIPVIAVYLLNDNDCNPDDEGNLDDDAGNWDWEAAEIQGRLLVDVDELTEEEYAAMTTGREIKRTTHNAPNACDYYDSR